VEDLTWALDLSWPGQAAPPVLSPFVEISAGAVMCSTGLDVYLFINMFGICWERLQVFSLCSPHCAP
jgi:hypothetical protein